MKYFQKIKEGIDVSGVLAELKDHPELWDEHKERTISGSPHYGCSDIWLRFRAREELTEIQNYGEPHFAEFYPAWYALPSLEPIVFDLMAELRPRAVYLGGMLMTKIPPRERVKPHNDRIGWHACFHDTKVYIGIQSNERCVNYCEDESTIIRAGEAVVFNNLLTHSVENNGETDRITLICCFRTMGAERGS